MSSEHCCIHVTTWSWENTFTGHDGEGGQWTTGEKPKGFFWVKKLKKTNFSFVKRTALLWKEKKKNPVLSKKPILLWKKWNCFFWQKKYIWFLSKK